MEITGVCVGRGLPELAVRESCCSVSPPPVSMGPVSTPQAASSVHVHANTPVGIYVLSCPYEISLINLTGVHVYNVFSS